ncbi:ribosomal protein s21 protein [Diplodia corticola]|uniref:Ribosomal protein s21 protein n=1 Tax=Diplodia corticola TaxID=236234 RepID=A0A1J9R8L1_9PEZI|nr:ribosomal protein s21 protein [Diplodia corticola]OJD28739.1 ribosomal protein s21 protein [Diplodia corticola]
MLSTRTYSVSAARGQQEPVPSYPTETPSDSPSQPSQNQAAPSKAASISSLLDDRIDFNRPQGTKRTSRFASPSAQHTNRNTTAYNVPSGSSADEAAARFDGALSSSTSGRIDSLIPNMGRTTSATGNSLGNLFNHPYWGAAAKQKSLVEPPDPATLPRLGPTIGRSVTIRDNVDLAKGLRNLDVICARNRVRGDFNKQRFHERPGLKRKRLASERWRKRFMDGFKATVSRVQYLKRQGW